ncbi:MAG: cytochrome c-type biogenesis protein CcmH [Bradyrhizobiaceae bacterium]|nr:cytochrome c-type biogenesis protein CcmH [Bradyrhizobiaceae bacterium]
MKLLRLLTLCAALFGTHAALAVEPDEVLADPALEARARTISRELRCMVCQNQSIDDSGAPLAHDLRVLVRERLKSGDNDQQVLDFLVARYGEFVLLKPRFEWRTALLWLTPFTVLILGAMALVAATKRRKGATDPAADKLSAAEEARISELMRSPGE